MTICPGEYVLRHVDWGVRRTVSDSQSVPQRLAGVAAACLAIAGACSLLAPAPGRAQGMAGMPGMQKAAAPSAARDISNSSPSAPAGAPAGAAAYIVSIDQTPPPIGLGRIVVHVRNRSTGAPETAGRVIVKASMVTMPMGEAYKVAPPVSGHPGEYAASWPYTMVGQWKVQAEYQGAAGSVDVQALVSPGSQAVPAWGWMILSVVALALIIGVLRLLRTPVGRAKLRHTLRARNVAAGAVVLALAIGSMWLVQKVKAGKPDTSMNDMSMTQADYTSPTPVTVLHVHGGRVSAAVIYTGSVAPYYEDTIYSRLTGRIVSTLYAGDRVSAGQVVAQLEQPDVNATADEAGYGVVAANTGVDVAQSQLAQARSAAASAEAVAAQSAGAILEARQTEMAASSAVTLARSDLEGARQEQDGARADLQVAESALTQSQARLASKQADAAYWQPEIKREQALLKRGAVSLDEYQAELAKAQGSQAAVDEAHADVTRAGAVVTSARANVARAASKAQAAQAQIAQMQATEGAQAARVSQMDAAARAAWANAQDAVGGVATADSRVRSTLAVVQQARSAQKVAAVNVDYLSVMASESGVVTKRLADPGVVVSPGMGILKVAQLDRVRLQANVSSVDLAKFRVGMPVTASIQGYPAPISAHVTGIFPAADPTTRTSIVEAVVSNPGEKLLPGQFVTMQFYAPTGRPTLSVPLTAVTSLAQAVSSISGQNAAGNAVWTVVDGKAHLAPVTLGATDGVNQAVLSGLKDGDLIITSDTESLTEGTPVSYAGMPQLEPQATSSGVSSMAARSASQTGAAGSTTASLAKHAGGMVQQAGSMTADLSFKPSPPQVGDESVILTLTDAKGAPVKGARVQFSSEMVAMNMPGPSASATDNGDGAYLASLNLSMGSAWRITASVTPAGGSPVSADFNFQVK